MDEKGTESVVMGTVHPEQHHIWIGPFSLCEWRQHGAYGKHYKVRNRNSSLKTCRKSALLKIIYFAHQKKDLENYGADGGGIGNGNYDFSVSAE